MNRPRNSTHSAPAAPVTKLPMAVPMSEMTMTGLRPMRSLSRPSSGANTSWANENVANSQPTAYPEAPNRSAYTPRIGTTMPNPMRSSATVDQMVQYPLGNGVRSPFSARRDTATRSIASSPPPPSSSAIPSPLSPIVALSATSGASGAMSHPSGSVRSWIHAFDPLRRWPPLNTPSSPSSNSSPPASPDPCGRAGCRAID